MTTNTLNERITKIEERIAKKYNTIKSKEQLIIKKQQAIIKAGYSLADKEAARSDMNIFWMLCEIEFLEDDLRRLPREIEELKNTLQKYQDQLIKASDEENSYANEVPECLKALEQQLADKWTAFDIARKNTINQDIENMDKQAFARKYSAYERRELRYRSDDAILEDNKKDAKVYVLELFNRIKNITGEITDWTQVYLTNGARGCATLNGVVTGKQGRCKVESIYAEGPIQRLHVRVLTKELN